MTDIDGAIERALNRFTGFLARLEKILCDAYGVDRREQIMLRYVDHIPHPEVVIPLMRAMGGGWQMLLEQMEAFTAEQKAKSVGAGVGAAYIEEAKKAVERA